MEKNFQYRGDLRDTTLPEMLSTIERFGVPGTIEARDVASRVTKNVLVRDGKIIYAGSSDRVDSLGRHLLKTGALSEQAFHSTMQAREDSESRYGELLVERKLLSPAEVHTAIQTQVEEIVWSLFYWRQGQVSFSIGEVRTRGAVVLQLPLRQVILKGIQRAPNAKTLAARLGKKHSVFTPAFRTEDLINLALSSEELEILEMVDGRRSVYKICTDSPWAGAETAKLMYAFKVLRLIRGSQIVPPIL